MTDQTYLTVEEARKEREKLVWNLNGIQNQINSYGMWADKLLEKYKKTLWKLEKIREFFKSLDID